jgi:hypothetical protein
MITLYFRSSGDGNVSKLSTIGFDKSRSMTKMIKIDIEEKSILPLKVSFKILAITPCCSYEQ